ncbi:transforming protein E5 [Deltapapillomavirus 3]|uniref:transforming protein E5 n=1 Tax=Deltapapillomavirus 3 TaxID=56144 RepID=UPI0000161E5D|nr:transforming protein E5 [Deltapapillomavirus 3]
MGLCCCKLGMQHPFLLLFLGLLWGVQLLLMFFLLFFFFIFWDKYGCRCDKLPV